MQSVDVFWFDDRRIGGQCRVPKRMASPLSRRRPNGSRSADAVQSAIEMDRFNAASFSPVTTSALRLEVELQPNMSSGILEWKVAGARSRPISGDSRREHAPPGFQSVCRLTFSPMPIRLSNIRMSVDEPELALPARLARALDVPGERHRAVADLAQKSRRPRQIGGRVRLFGRSGRAGRRAADDGAAGAAQRPRARSSPMRNRRSSCRRRGASRSASGRW